MSTPETPIRERPEIFCQDVVITYFNVEHYKHDVVANEYSLNLFANEFNEVEFGCIQSASLDLVRATDGTSFDIQGRITFDPDPKEYAGYYADTLYDCLAMAHYEEEQVTRKGNRSIHVDLGSHKKAQLGVFVRKSKANVQPSKMIGDIRIQLSSSLSETHTAFSDIERCTELWGLVMDTLLAVDARKENHTTEPSRVYLKTTSDQTFTDAGAAIASAAYMYDFWQSDLSKRVDPAVDFEDIDFIQLGRMFGIVEPTFIYKAMKLAAETRRAEFDVDPSCSRIDHIALLHALHAVRS